MESYAVDDAKWLNAPAAASTGEPAFDASTYHGGPGRIEETPFGTFDTRSPSLSGSHPQIWAAAERLTSAGPFSGRKGSFAASAGQVLIDCAVDRARAIAPDKRGCRQLNHRLFPRRARLGGDEPFH